VKTTRRQCSWVCTILLAACSSNSDPSSKADATTPPPTQDAAISDAEISDATASVDAGHAEDAGHPDAQTNMPPSRTEVTFTSSDGLKISAYLTAGSSSPAGAPGVLLLHQYNQDSSQWGNLPERLAEQGYRSLAIDLRGHGTSDPYGGNRLSDILNDPNGAPLDVNAALAYLKGDGQADPTRIAIIGTSIGANLAVASAVKKQAKTYIAFSPRKPPTENVAGTSAEGMSSVFYLAGELDSGGQAQDCQTMFESTSDPKSIVVYLGSSDHGLDLLQNQVDAESRIFDWLTENL